MYCSSVVSLGTSWNDVALEIWPCWYRELYLRNFAFLWTIWWEIDATICEGIVSFFSWCSSQAHADFP